VVPVLEVYCIIVDPHPRADLNGLHHGGHVITADIEEIGHGLHFVRLSLLPHFGIALKGGIVTPPIHDRKIPEAVHPEHVLVVGLEKFQECLLGESPVVEFRFERSAVIRELGHLFSPPQSNPNHVVTLSMGSRLLMSLFAGKAGSGYPMAMEITSRLDSGTRANSRTTSG